METDANTDEVVEETTVEPDSSPAKSYEPIEEDGFVSTTEFKEVEVDSEEVDDGGDTSQKQEKPDSEKTDFSQHPRFQELIKEKNELKDRLSKIEAEKQQPGKKPESKSKYNFNNVMGMEDDEIVDQFTNSPKSFLANFAQQVAHEIMSDVQAEQQAKAQEYEQQTTQQKAVQNLQEFFKDKDDGIAMLQDGTIESFMKQNPGHNPISAYYALAGEQHTKSQVEAAVKKERDKLLKQLKAAGKAGPVRGETASRSYADTSPTPAKNKADLKQRMLKRMLSG
jgi:hypothetical protein